MLGTFWTLAPYVLDPFPGMPAAPTSPWTLVVDDPVAGPVHLTGSLTRGSSDLLVLVHGHGGSIESHYMRRALQVASRRGHSVLRYDLRGAGAQGGDFYHAGLTSDLHAALSSPALAAFERIAVLGYSLGGHLALRLAAEPLDPRVRAVAAICAPLDLHLTCEALDRPKHWFYRGYLLRQVKAMYARVAARRPQAVPLAKALAIRSLRAWDEVIIAPRWGFASAADYYEQMSAGRRLGALRVPALLVAAEADPLVFAHTLRPSLASAPPLLETRWVRGGGHVGFPGGLDLGFGGARGLEAQAMTWLAAR